MNAKNVNLVNLEYSVWKSNPIGDIKIHEGNPFNLTQIAAIDIMGITKENNLFFKTSIKYYHKNKTLEMSYVTEYKVQSKINMKDTKSEILKSLLTELHFRHQIHIHQFLHRLWEKNLEFPPYLTNLYASLEFVTEELQKTESLNN